MDTSDAFVDNKMLYEVYANGELVESLRVHPNMIQLPRVGDTLVLTKVLATSADGRSRSCLTQGFKVQHVIVTHRVERRTRGTVQSTNPEQNVVTTMLEQHVIVQCEPGVCAV